MLAATTILMSLGTDLVGAPHIPSGRADTATISFAKSFDEGSALAGEIQAQVGNGKKLKDAAVGEDIIPAKIANLAVVLGGTKAKADVGAGNRIQNELDDPKRIIPVMDTKASGTSGAAKVTTTLKEGLPHSEKANEDKSTDIPVEGPDNQLYSSGAKEVVQRVPSGVSEVIEGAQKEALVPQAIANMAAPSLPENGEKPVVRNQKEALLVEINQETVLAKKAAKNDDGIAKTEKAAKTEKMEKAAGTMANLLEIKTPAVAEITVPAVAVPINGQQSLMSTAAEDNDLSSIASATTGRTVGMSANMKSKAIEKPTVAGKADGDNMKTVVSALPDGTASRKTEFDGVKIAPSVAKEKDIDNTKTQSAVAAVPIAGQTHAEPGMFGTAIGGAPGSAAAHPISTKSQVVESNSHTTTGQAGSGAMDTAGSVDAAPRTLTATPTALEIGVASGTHGWLKIRAEMTGDGVVNASLSTATSLGQEMLHRELPSMTAYLQSERVAINTVVVQPTVAAGVDARGFAGGMNGDGREQAPQSGGQGGENRQSTASAVLDRTTKDLAYNGLSGVGGEELLSLASYAGGGNWLSVRA